MVLRVPILQSTLIFVQLQQGRIVILVRNVSQDEVLAEVVFACEKLKGAHAAARYGSKKARDAIPISSHSYVQRGWTDIECSCRAITGSGIYSESMKN